MTASENPPLCPGHVAGEGVDGSGCDPSALSDQPVWTPVSEATALLARQ